MHVLNELLVPQNLFYVLVNPELNVLHSNDITHIYYTHYTGKFEIWNTTHIHKCSTSLLHRYVTNICCGRLYAVYYILYWTTKSVCMIRGKRGQWKTFFVHSGVLPVLFPL